MISSLTGTVAEILPGAVELEVTGVGYLVNVPVSTVAKVKKGQHVRLVTQLVVREDSMTLYGFDSLGAKHSFVALTSVTGVGPKLALAVLSALGPAGLAKAVASEDVALLTEVPGIGRRGAQRMIVELKGRLGDAVDAAPVGSKITEVREALIALGYAPGELREVIDRVAGDDDKEIEQMIKEALKELARV